MREYSSAKNLLEQKRIQKKNPKNPKIQESRNSINELRKKLKEIRINLDEHDEKTRLYNIENKTNKLLDEFAEIKQNIGKLNDTMVTILLITLSGDAGCPHNQRIKINNILKKQRENIIRKFIKNNPNNANNNQINANIPINTTQARKIKINSSFKNDNLFFNKKYEHQKYSVYININNTNNASKVNLKKKTNIADSSLDDFSSKKS